MRIGCCWAGAPRFSRDEVRSIPYATFAPLFDLPGTSWVALFTGPQRDHAPRHANVERPRLDDLCETARYMRQIDLMISVDSLPAHLAGTLGVPTWVLLPFSADWRWLLGRTDSVWYPTVKLYRAERWNDWPPVVDRVAADLRRIIPLLSPAKDTPPCRPN